MPFWIPLLQKNAVKTICIFCVCLLVDWLDGVLSSVNRNRQRLHQGTAVCAVHSLKHTFITQYVLCHQVLNQTIENCVAIAQQSLATPISSFFSMALISGLFAIADHNDYASTGNTKIAKKIRDKTNSYPERTRLLLTLSQFSEHLSTGIDGSEHLSTGIDGASSNSRQLSRNSSLACVLLIPIVIGSWDI